MFLSFSCVLDIRPTFVYSVPRFFETLHILFKEAVKTFNKTSSNGGGGGDGDGYQRAVQLFRSAQGPLGDRVCSLSIGSAPVTPQLYKFLNQVYGAEQGGTATVSRGYGSVSVLFCPPSNISIYQFSSIVASWHAH